MKKADVGTALRLAVMWVLLLPVAAAAWPVDWIHDVEAGKEKFIRLPRLDWFEVEDPKVAKLEWLEESGELLVTGLKPGRTVVLLGADGKVAAWRIRVGSKPVTDDAAFAGAQKACPDLRPTPLEDVKLSVTVGDEACRKALAALFQTDAFEARHLELTFAGSVLQAQLKSVEEGLKAAAGKKATARYVGAGLVLEGQVSREEHRKILWEVLKRTLGRFALDDRLLLPAPPDAGAE
ncbi:MAG: hypothetical protein AB1938_28010 [Myxococcota bacterium]